MNLIIFNILKFKNFILFIILVLFLISVSFNFYLYFKYKKDRVLIIKPQAILEDMTAEAPTKVSKLMRLPQDEQPQVFTINGNTPRNQSFIKEAKNGDVLLLYLKNQKAILFDPVKNQILKVGPLTFSSPSAELKNNENKINSLEFRN